MGLDLDEEGAADWNKVDASAARALAVFLVTTPLDRETEVGEESLERGEFEC